MTRIKKVSGWGYRIVGVLSVLSIVGAVYTNIHWWIDWVSLFVALGAALSSLVISIFPAFAIASALEKVDSDSMCWDSWPFVAFCNICIAICVSMMLWYHHALTPSHEGFWWPCMPLVSFVIPLLITGSLLIASSIARNKDLASEATSLEADKVRWKPYVLGDGLAAFKDKVENFRKQINIHFAEKCCMRLISASSIEWEVADEYIENSDNTYSRRCTRNKLKGESHPAFALIETVFRIKGRNVDASIELIHTGEARLTWEEGSAKQIETWQAVVSMIDKKIGG